jgi:hypothetical protein
MAEAMAIDADALRWRLFTLAEEGEFARHVEAAAAAIADRFTLKAHINLAERHAAHIAWLARVREIGKRSPDYRAFIAVCAAMTAALAAHNVAGYSAMIRDPADRMVATVIAYGNEVTALAAGAGLYAVAVEDLTGSSPVTEVTALMLENAASHLRRNPDAAAARFRELMGLSTPWCD